MQLIEVLIADNDMKYVLINFACVLAWLLLLAFVSAGCREPREPFETKPNIQVTTYNLTKLVKDQTHKIPSNLLRAVVPSGDGENIYVVGNGKASLMVFDVANKKWEPALGTWKDIKKAANHTVSIDLSAHEVDEFAAYNHGLMLTVTGDNGLVVLKGVGVNNSSHYAQGANKFPVGTFAPFFVTNKDSNHFIYLHASKKTPPQKGLLFRVYAQPPKNDDDAASPWNNSLKKTRTPNVELDKKLIGLAQDHDKNLYIADPDGIKRIKEEDIGKNKKALDNGGAAIFPTDDFKLDQHTVNKHINVMALVGKFLVVGLESDNDKNGGVAIADITKKQPTWDHFGDGLGLSVNSIAPELCKNADKTMLAAIIATNKGLLFLGDDGKMVEMVKGKGMLIDHKAINDWRAETKDYNKASGGFTGTLVPEPDQYLGAAQDKNCLWSLGFAGKQDDDGGIYLLDIKIDQVEYPKAPPVLP